MDRAFIASCLTVSLEALRSNDDLLLEYDVHERTIAAKLAYYLTPMFPRLHVDVEYNKHGVDPKRVWLDDPCRSLAAVKAGSSLVVPDIVVHRRGIDSENLLAIELKKSTNRIPRECDEQKLRAYRAELGYTFVTLLEIPAGTNWRQLAWPPATVL